MVIKPIIFESIIRSKSTVYNTKRSATEAEVIRTHTDFVSIGKQIPLSKIIADEL